MCSSRSELGKLKNSILDHLNSNLSLPNFRILKGWCVLFGLSVLFHFSFLSPVCVLVFIIVAADVFFNVSPPLCSLISTDSPPYVPVKIRALGVNKFSLYFIDINLSKISKAPGKDFVPRICRLMWEKSLHLILQAKWYICLSFLSSYHFLTLKRSTAKNTQI